MNRGGRLAYDGGMRSAALLACLLSAPANAAESVLGFNYPVWSKTGYASSDSALADVAATGAGWVALTPTLYVKDRTDSVVAATADTPDDDSLRAAIRAAKARGLKVVLKPHVDIVGGGVRAWISPKDSAQWFSTYRVPLLRYARIAQEEGCSLFVVGTELALLTAPSHWGSWKSLIRDVRAEYQGPLTYAANWHSTLGVGFWKDLDYIGVDAYYPNLGGKNRTLLRLGWLPVEGELKALSAANGRPILFTEFGIASQKGANLRPWDWTDFGPVDVDQQAAYMQTFFETFAGKSYVAGFLHWAWDADPTHQGLSDKSMSVRGKPAEALLESLFRGARVAASSPPPSPPHALAAARAAAVMAGAPALLR